jgi:hypothetical protein
MHKDTWQQPDRVRFFAKLGDGSEHPFEVDAVALRGGDGIALTFAVELQAVGRIPCGDILSIRRAPEE